MIGVLIEKGTFVYILTYTGRSPCEQIQGESCHPHTKEGGPGVDPSLTASEGTDPRNIFISDF